MPNSVFPASTVVASSSFPVSTINLLENTSQSWYDAGYVNLRRRYAHGLSILANYTFAKSLEDAPDFRSPMFEAATPQDNDNLKAEKGPGCDIRHRFSLSAVYNTPTWACSNLDTSGDSTTGGPPRSTRCKPDSRSPFRSSEIRRTRARWSAKIRYAPIPQACQSLARARRNATTWFNPAAFATPAAYTYGNVGRNSVYGPGMQTLDLGLVRAFHLTERIVARDTRGVLQCPESHQPGHAQSVCEYGQLRQHHRSLDPRPRDSGQRAPLLLME